MNYVYNTNVYKNYKGKNIFVQISSEINFHLNSSIFVVKTSIENYVFH